MGDRHTAPCPHPSCHADLAMPTTLPDGVYRCICNGTRVRLRWVTRGGARIPRLTNEEDRTDD